MKLLFKNLTLFLITVIILTGHASAQPRLATPLIPEELVYQIETGAFIGFGQNIEGGKFLTSCDCEFDYGVGLGYTVGALYEKELFREFVVGIAGAYDYRGVQASYFENEQGKVYSQAQADSINVLILFKHKAEAGFGYLSAIPYVKWEPLDFFFIKLGLSGSFLTSATIKQTKILQERTKLLPTGEVVDVSIDGPSPTEVVVEDGKFPETKSFVLSLLPMAGLNFQLDNNIYFSPMFQYQLPFSEASSRGSSFKLSSWRLTLELRIVLQQRSYL